MGDVDVDDGRHESLLADAADEGETGEMRSDLASTRIGYLLGQLCRSRSSSACWRSAAPGCPAAACRRISSQCISSRNASLVRDEREPDLHPLTVAPPVNMEAICGPPIPGLPCRA